MKASLTGILGLIGAACTVATAANAATLRVPQQYGTIQAAVNAALEGDVVRVAAGTYVEHVVITGKAITLAGAGSAQTIIDAQGTGRNVTVSNTGAGQVTISGFTIKNGNGEKEDIHAIGYMQGGGIYAEIANVAIRNNVVTANHGCLGTAIATLEATVVLTRNRVEDNLSSPDCGQQAIMIRANQGGQSTVSGNVIQNHDVTGLILQAAGKVTVSNNIFRNNTANTPTNPLEYGGLINLYTELTLSGNLFTGNTGRVSGGAQIGDFEGGTVRVTSNSFVGNHSEVGPSAIQFMGYLETDFVIQGNRFDESADRPAVACAMQNVVDQSNIFAADPTTALGGACVPTN